MAMTATEVAARERASITTRGRKIGYTRPPVASALETLLMVDAVVFNSGVTPVKPDLDFGDYVGQSTSDLAKTAQLLVTAEAASMETRVSMVHPEWDGDQVQAEVALIRADQQSSMSVPGLDAGMGLTGPGTSQDQQQQEPAPQGS